MNFVSSPFLYALAGLAVPVVIHLIFRRQTRRVDLGTTRFLAELLRETARRRRVQRWLLLALRMACVALLAVLFARPFLLAEQAGNERRLLVCLIDRSASLSLAPEGERLVDVAVRRVAEMLKEAPPDTETAIAWFDTGVTPISNDREPELEAPPMLWGGTRYGAALSWARDICLKSTASRRDVYVWTDLQRSGLDWTAAAPFPDDVRVHVEDLGRDIGNNVAVVRVVPARTLLRPGQGVRVEATLYNFGRFSHEETPVLLTLRNGAQTIREHARASLRPGEAVEVGFEVAGLSAGLWEATVAVDVEDDLPFDNVRWFALLSAARQRVLIVSRDDSETGDVDGVWFLERALRLSASGTGAEQSPFQTQTVRLPTEPLPRLSDFDLVVLADAGRLTPADAATLSSFVREGGGLLVFTGEQMTPDACRPLMGAGLAPGEIREVVYATDLPFRWDHWDDRHLALAPFSDPQNGDLRRLAYFAYTPIVPHESTRVLASYGNGAPALTEHRIGSGRVLWFLSGCHRTWGDWVRSRLFLPLVHQLLGDLAQLTGGGPVQERLLGEATPAPGGGVIESPSRPGVVEAGERWYVFNVNPLESDGERCTAEELADRFRFRLAPRNKNSGEAAEVIPEPAGLETRHDEVWPWVACLLIGVLGLEWFLANRTTA